jgi:cell division GTPase FtsZ
MARAVKDRYVGKPVYTLVVLPFEHEQSTESRSTYNTATCLKSTYDIVDAVFLADNQRYVRKDASLMSNIDRINRMIAEPFYDLMCAGEVTRAKYVGSRTIDGGDIIASLEGWTAIGLGRTELPSFRFPWEIRKKSFREKALESFRGTQALDATVSDLSLTCDAKDAGKAIYIVSGPEKELNMDMVKSISDYIKELAPNALIRGGDFPGEKHFVDVALILSQLSFVPRIAEFYEQATHYAKEHEVQLKQTRKRIESLAEIGKDLPTLE